MILLKDFIDYIILFDFYSSSVSDLRKSSEEKMSTGSDNQATTNNDVHRNNNNYDEESQSDDFVDSCSCTGTY